VVHGEPASIRVGGDSDPESAVEVGREVEVDGPASGASLAGGWGDPFAPQ